MSSDKELEKQLAETSVTLRRIEKELIFAARMQSNTTRMSWSFTLFGFAFAVMSFAYWFIANEIKLMALVSALFSTGFMVFSIMLFVTSRRERKTLSEQFKKEMKEGV